MSICPCAAWKKRLLRRQLGLSLGDVGAGDFAGFLPRTGFVHLVLQHVEIELADVQFLLITEQVGISQYCRNTGH